MTPATTTAIEQAIDYITRHGHVSFPELQRFAENELHMNVHGNYALEAVPNLILWADCSAEFIDLIDGIRATNKIDLNPTSTLVYIVDGAMLRLPIAKRPPRGGYKTPRWAPTVLHPTQEASK